MLGVTLFWEGAATAAVRPLTDAVAMARRTVNLLGETYAMGYLALTHIERGMVVDGQPQCNWPGAVPGVSSSPSRWPLMRRPWALRTKMAARHWLRPSG